MDIQITQIGVDNEYDRPAIKITLKLLYRGRDEAPIYIRGFTLLEGKIIGSIELHELMDPHFYLDPVIENNSGIEYQNSAVLSSPLTNNIIAVINEKRKKNPKRDVILMFRIYITSLINHISLFKPTAAREGNLLMLSSKKNSYLNIYISRYDLPYTIPASDWVNDFIPKSRLGKYEIIEIPNLKGTGPDNILKSIQEAKNQLYGNLDIGAALTALRNSLRNYKDYVKSKGGYDKIFTENENLESLADTLQEKLHGVASRSNTDTAAHKDEKVVVEGYDVESMIFMAYSLYRMTFERLKEENRQ